MKVRSKVPLRLGLAGGGTDVSPYCDMYGGCILNATIDLFAYCTLCPANDGMIRFTALDREETFEAPVAERLETNGTLDLHKGVYNRVIKEFRIEPFAFDLKSHSDAPSGSGLGSSSTMVVRFFPSKIISPSSTSNKPTIHFCSTVLPLPLVPIIRLVRPVSITALTFFNICLSPKDLEICSTSMILPP